MVVTLVGCWGPEVVEMERPRRLVEQPLDRVVADGMMCTQLARDSHMRVLDPKCRDSAFGRPRFSVLGASAKPTARSIAICVGDTWSDVAVVMGWRVDEGRDRCGPITRES